MVKQKLITLGEDGVLSDEKSIALKLYEYFLSAEYSQTRFWTGEVKSFKWLLAEFQHDEVEFANAVKGALEDLYGNFISDVKIDVKTSIDEYGTGVVTFIIGTNKWNLELLTKISKYKLDLLDGFANLNMEGRHDA